MNTVSSSDPITVDIENGIAELKFNRPDRLNALDVEMATAFRSSIDRVVARADVRAILLSGIGKAFLAGGDLRLFRDSVDRRETAQTLIGAMHEGILQMIESQIPTIAALHGAVAGAGFSMAALTDFAIAADNTRFVMAYINIAANPDCGGSWALPRLVGRRKAAEIALLSDPIDASEALQLGLVNRVVPISELSTAARELAGRIANGPTAAIRSTRSLLNLSTTTPLRDHLEAELECFKSAAVSPDFDEALNAFFDRRRPRFHQS